MHRVPTRSLAARVHRRSRGRATRWAPCKREQPLSGAVPQPPARTLPRFCARHSSRCERPVLAGLAHRKSTLRSPLTTGWVGQTAPGLHCRREAAQLAQGLRSVGAERSSPRRETSLTLHAQAAQHRLADTSARDAPQQCQEQLAARCSHSTPLRFTSSCSGRGDEYATSGCPCDSIALSPGWRCACVP